MVTTPNLAWCWTSPAPAALRTRWNAFSIAFEEFAKGGIPCALHAHGRTERDFERWRAEIAIRNEIETLSYEFTTGPGRRALLGPSTPRSACRPRTRSWQGGISISLCGDPGSNRITYAGTSAGVIYLETSAFMKTLKRQRAERDGNDRLRWTLSPTEPGEALDGLFSHNLRERVSLVQSLHYAEEAAG